MEFTYLDHAAAGVPNAHLAEWYGELLSKYFVNPHGGTCYSEECRRVYLSACRRLLSLLGIDEREARVIFTSGVTEALTQAVCSFRNIVMDPGSHSAVVSAARKMGKAIYFPSQPTGEEASGPLLSCVNLVNNETGAVADIPAIKRLYPGAFLLADGAQALGRMEIPWHDGIDCLALSSRKIGGPASVGALVVRKGAPLEALIPGGGQQRGERGGTVDVVGAELFVRVLEEVMTRREENRRHVEALRRRLWAFLEDVKGVVRISPEEGSPYICMFSLPGYEGAVLTRLLAQDEAVQVSSSAACSAESGILSPYLQALGYDDACIRGALRVSFSGESRLEDVERFAAALKRVLANY